MPGTDETHVNFSTMSAGAAGIASNYKALVDTLHNLETELNPMVSTWNGQAREQYGIQKAAWERASQAMAATLAKLGQAVDTSHANFQAAERANLARWE